MANLQKRSGRVNIRVGGNTQETASLVDHLDGGKILEKDLAGAASNPVSAYPFPLCNVLTKAFSRPKLLRSSTPPISFT